MICSSAVVITATRSQLPDGRIAIVVPIAKLEETIMVMFFLKRRNCRGERADGNQDKYRGGVDPLRRQFSF
jgi:hypothetical protein